MKLYGSPISTCTRKVLCTLAEKGVSADFVHVELFKGEQKNEAYMSAHQPFGRVPAIEDGDFAMYESRAIMRYLDDALPGTRLTPADAKGRARMEQWTSVEYSYFSGPALKIIAERVFHPMLGMAIDEAKVAAGKKELSSTLDVLEARLAEASYLAGETFSLADIGYLPYVDYLFAANEGEMITSRAHVADWWKRVSERPSWKTATSLAR